MNIAAGIYGTRFLINGEYRLLPVFVRGDTAGIIIDVGLFPESAELPAKYVPLDRSLLRLLPDTALEKLEYQGQVDLEKRVSPLRT